MADRALAFVRVTFAQHGADYRRTLESTPPLETFHWLTQYKDAQLPMTSVQARQCELERARLCDCSLTAARPPVATT